MLRGGESPLSVSGRITLVAPNQNVECFETLFAASVVSALRHRVMDGLHAAVSHV